MDKPRASGVDRVRRIQLCFGEGNSMAKRNRGPGSEIRWP